MSDQWDEQWIDEHGETHTVTWWDRGKYNPWMPWHTSHHMIWAAPVVVCTVLLFALMVAMVWLT
jgi:hypothetical protein